MDTHRQNPVDGEFDDFLDAEEIDETPNESGNETRDGYEDEPRGVPRRRQRHTQDTERLETNNQFVKTFFVNNFDLPSFVLVQ